jgi:hypothetical protein
LDVQSTDSAQERESSFLVAGDGSRFDAEELPHRRANFFAAARISHGARSDDADVGDAARLNPLCVVLEALARSRDRLRFELLRFVDAFAETRDRRRFFDRTKETVPPLRYEKQDGVRTDVDRRDQ